MLADGPRALLAARSQALLPHSPAPNVPTFTLCLGARQNHRIIVYAGSFSEFDDRAASLALGPPPVVIDMRRSARLAPGHMYLRDAELVEASPLGESNSGFGAAAATFIATLEQVLARLLLSIPPTADDPHGVTTHVQRYLLLVGDAPYLALCAAYVACLAWVAPLSVTPVARRALHRPLGESLPGDPTMLLDGVRDLIWSIAFPRDERWGRNAICLLDEVLERTLM